MKEQVAWEASHSVAAEASASFAWSYLTDISNWNDPPATFQLDGPFREGARGATLMPDEEPRAWRIGRVTPGESYVLEMELEGATLSFTWPCEPGLGAHMSAHPDNHAFRGTGGVLCERDRGRLWPEPGSGYGSDCSRDWPKSILKAVRGRVASMWNRSGGRTNEIQWPFGPCP